MKDHTKIRAVAEDLIKLKFKSTDTVATMKKKFFSIMRKHGITKGTAVENGIIGDNFEWTICSTLFLSRVKSHIEFDLMLNSIPKDLRYEKAYHKVSENL